ncbi:MAG: hypothetical protein AAFQ74_06335 [Cyanobacteria bacterium J06623_4]
MRRLQCDRRTHAGIPIVRYRTSGELPQRLRKRSARFLSLSLSTACWASDVGLGESDDESGVMLENAFILTAKSFIDSFEEAA